MNCLYPITFIGLLLIYKTPQAQPVLDSTNSSYSSTNNYYQNEIGDRSLLYLGKEYAPYRSGVQGTQFFLSPQMQNGTILYDNVLFENVPFLFDLVRHDVVINRFEDNTRIKLITEKIGYFIIAGHRFENLKFRGETSEESGSDFFDIVFHGKTDVLVNRIKKIEMTLSPEDPPKFTERDKFFIRNHDNIYAIDDIKSVLKALADRKDQVKLFIRKNKLKFKSDTEEEIVKIAAYYESLNN